MTARTQQKPVPTNRKKNYILCINSEKKAEDKHRVICVIS